MVAGFFFTVLGVLGIIICYKIRQATKENEMLFLFQSIGISILILILGIMLIFESI